MGKARKMRRRDLNFAEKRRARENKWDANAPRREYQDIVRENADFEKYYKMQKICPEEEWDAFMATIKQNLPTAFRITGSKVEARALLRFVQSNFFNNFLNPGKLEGDSEEKQDAENVEQRIKPICLPWYPDGLAWQLQLTRKDIRRSEIYFRLHNFLIAETECGNISRQEVVSMIPPLLLDVQSHHKILDMCAAPGSKTAQLIELLHSDSSDLPDGFVIANDVDNNRCYMLVHQAKRLNSPCIIVTNHDSVVMPNLTITQKDGSKGILKYDRILCDVPCSGDGTMRKNPDIWVKWNAANGNNLHGIQFRILRRGVEMLAVGGRIVYSTCSLNPLENEAVLHRLLSETDGAVELVDVTNLLPGLVYSKGVSHWIPASRDLVGYQSIADVPDKWRTVIHQQMFPPAPENAEKYKLDRCIRILPHKQDTGGFFVAVLEKMRLLPWEAPLKPNDASSTEPSTEKKDSAPEPQRKRRRMHGYKEDPFIFFDENEPLWPQIRDFYDIDKNLQPTCLLTRCKEGKKKNIYFTSPAVRDIVLHNESNIKLINTGVKTFVRCDNRVQECPFRLAQEGLHSIYPYMGPKRKIKVTKSDLIALLMNDNPKFPPEATSLDQKTQQQLKDISQGSCVLVYEGEPTNDGDMNCTTPLHMVGWRGIKSVRAYVPTNDCVHYLRLLGADVSKYEVNKFKDKNVPDESSEKSESCLNICDKDSSASNESLSVDNGNSSQRDTVETSKLEAGEG
ncbi:tRNA (cytosine(34)-C(5))-methyltransferase [Schistocerca piceifrons]|uniref:tRNA (cytosine(34)-C(5))-methyltransferase n=1 Tax=Schistocerca piceifrons TaxID=274613 RepID=UPI001F5FF266|nr:tRNA (cytosine(34)-C(5))-methyltransferase [Schistocerca piceifrons]